MRILALSDEESTALRSKIRTGDLPKIDLIVSCGDLHPSYLDEVASGANALLVYVRGNHDYGAMDGGICIEDRVFTCQGVRLAGLGGSMRYRPGSDMYTENEMRWRALRLMPRIMHSRGIDVLVTHAPAAGYGDLEDLAHQGFEVFNTLMDRYKPRYMLHGHIHSAYGRIPRRHSHPSGTAIINTCGYQIIEI